MQTLTAPVESPSARLSRVIPGFFYSHRQTGEIIAVLSCDDGHHTQFMDASNFVRPGHVRELHNRYVRLHTRALRATREVVLDHSGEWVCESVVWSVDRAELFAVMRELVGERAAA